MCSVVEGTGRTSPFPIGTRGHRLSPQSMRGVVTVRGGVSVMGVVKRRGEVVAGPKHAGFALVEALFAMVIVTVGLLGLAMLMLEGLRLGHLALLQTQAVNLASDLVDRIRANPGAGAAYACAEYGGAPAEHDCAPTDSSIGSNCTATQLAEDDLARWQRAAREALPLSGEPCAANVVFVPGSLTGEPPRYDVSLAWYERGEPEPTKLQLQALIAPPVAH